MDDERDRRFDQALIARESGDLSRAKELLLDLHLEQPASLRALATLADVCWDMKLLDEAIVWFALAVNLHPSSELVSLGLFHCLWEAERTDDAFGEMRRFLSNNESDAYSALLKDMNG